MTRYVTEYFPNFVDRPKKYNRSVIADAEDALNLNWIKEKIGRKYIDKRYVMTAYNGQNWVIAILTEE